MKRKKIMNAVLDAFPEHDFEIYVSNTDDLIRVDLKGYMLSADQIALLFKVHPFQIMLTESGSISKSTFILFFSQVN